ncbi:MAG: zinc-binding dehydrogenase [Pyrinomonadaceae bacterium]
MKAVRIHEFGGADKLRVMVQEFSLAEAAQAHAALEGRKTTGKVVLRL